MFWYGTWGSGLWPIFPMLMCIGMMVVMMLMMGRGHMGMGHMMGGHDGEHTDQPHSDPALDTLRQRFASGELTQGEYEEQRDLLLRV